MKIRLLTHLATLAIVGLSAAVAANAAEIGTATITSTQISPGKFQYNLTLNDTGTTKLGTFWFAWIPGDNFMPVTPTGITSPAGWQEIVTSGGPSNGYAIQWTAQAPADDLAAGSSLSGFSFDSTLTLAQLEAPAAGHPADPVATAVVYSGAPFSDAGFQFTAKAAAPEPSDLVLSALAVAAFLLCLKRRTSFHFSSGSASKSPNLSNRLSQIARRFPVHCSTTESPAGSMLQVLTLPAFSVFTKPHSSSTCRC